MDKNKFDKRVKEKLNESINNYGTSSGDFWADNINVLFDTNKLIYFFPSGDYSMVQNLNSIVRMFFYIAIIMILYTRDVRYIFLPIMGMIITLVLFRYFPKKKKELFEIKSRPLNRSVIDKKRLLKKKKCVLPTVDNPFMNFNYITDNYHRPPACKAFLENNNETLELRKDIDSKFNEKLYRDVGDLYSKRNSQREFFTIPYNVIPDQTAFAKWCNRTPGPTCKENGLFCGPYTGTMN